MTVTKPSHLIFIMRILKLGKEIDMNDNNIFDSSDKKSPEYVPFGDETSDNTADKNADVTPDESYTPADDIDTKTDSASETVSEEVDNDTYDPEGSENSEEIYAYKEADQGEAHSCRPQVYINGASCTEGNTQESAAKQKSKGKRGISTIALVAVLCVLLSGLAAFGGTYLASRVNGGAAGKSVIYQSIYRDGGTITNTDSTFGKVGTYAEVAAKVAGSVVEIRTETVSTSSIFSQYITEGAGSGVIITADGYIITNNHVIEGASTVTVTTHDGSKYPAEVIGYDSESDLAVLKIDASMLTPAVVGDSTKLVVGEEVIAIGNPLGSLGGTVTNGIISALARQVTIDGTEMTLLQTNAAVNPGNSGGGLFNLAGELIGIVNAKSSGSSIEGLGFAIPSNMASQVVEQLINYGYVRGRVSLGISYMDISDSYTAMMYRVNTLGIYILESEYNDELKIGDRVTAVDGIEVTYGSDIKAILKEHKVGDKITLTVVREGKFVEVEMECHEYVPGKTEEDKDKTEQNSLSDIFTSPFSSWFGY